MGRWNHELTPERFNSLRPALNDEVWKRITESKPDSGWRSSLRARSAADTFVQLRELLVPAKPNLTYRNSDIDDERQRAEFAPRSQILDPSYIQDEADAAMFRRLRGPLRVGVQTMAGWLENLSEDRRPAALSYLICGNLGRGLQAEILSTPRRPAWLQNYGKINSLLSEVETEPYRRQQLLVALFPDRFHHLQEEAPPVPSQSDPQIFFRRLEDWWSDADVRQRTIAEYEKRAWPDWLRQSGIADGLRSDSADHWLALLVLGACRSLGNTKAEQH